MSTLKVKLQLETRGSRGAAQLINAVDTLTITNPTINLSRVTATTTGNATIIAPSVDAERFVYIKNLGLTSAGAINTTDKLKVETADGVHIAELRAGEFLFLPFYDGNASLLQLEASANTIQAEYAYFTRG